MKKIATHMIVDARILAERILVPDGSRVTIETQRAHGEGWNQGDISINRGGVYAHYSAAAVQSATSFLSSRTQPTSHEVTIFVAPEDMEYAIEHLDEYRDELKSLAFWERLNFGVSLEESE